MAESFWAGLANWRRRRQRLGARAERAAARHLRRHGYRILARNLRDRFGEVDLLAECRRDKVIAIVEVKAGTHDNPPPESHVDARKRFKLTGLAQRIVRQYRFEDRPIRFDVVGIVWPRDSPRPTRITHHPGAFDAAY